MWGGELTLDVGGEERGERREGDEILRWGVHVCGCDVAVAANDVGLDSILVCVRRLHTPRPHPRLIDPRAHDPSPVTSTTITTYREKKQIYTRIHHHHHHMANLPESLSHCKPSKHGDKTQPTLPTTSCHEPKTSPAPPPPLPLSQTK